MAKVKEIDQAAKQFIAQQVGIHNKAIDYLGLMQMCKNKISKLAKVIDGINGDRHLIHEFALYQHNEILTEAVTRHDDQVMVYRRLLSRYLAHLTTLYTDALYHDTNRYSQELLDKLKKIAA